MVKFTCLTCYKQKDDKELKWYKENQVCSRCYDKYERLDK